jgi:hypothetical protein
MHRRIWYGVLWVLLLVACVPQPLPPTPSPAPIPFLPTLTPPLPTATPTLSPTPLPTSTPDPLAVHAQALIPSARGDLLILSDLPRYTIELEIDWRGRTLRGHQSITYTNRSPDPLPELWLMLYPNSVRFGAGMSVSAVEVNDQPTTPTLDSTRTALLVPLPAPLPSSGSVTLDMDFIVQVPHDEANTDRVLVYAHDTFVLGDWYPMLAVYDETGWNTAFPPTNIGEQVFSEAAFHDVRVTLPSDAVVISTGVQVDAADHGNGTQTVTLVSGPAREFMLVAGRGFDVQTRQVGESTVRACAWPEHVTCSSRIIDMACEALQLYGDLWGTYPYSELDLVEIQAWSWGVEWPGVILVGSPLYAEDDCGEWHVIHEVAHQWWYALVGNDQVDEPWLDEALANYATLVFYRLARNPAVAEERIHARIYDRYAQYLSRYPDRPVAGPTSSFDQASYYPIVYGKGAMAFEALQERIGETALHAGLREYAARHRHGIGTPEDLLAALEWAGEESLADWYDEWIEGTR